MKPNLILVLLTAMLAGMVTVYGDGTDGLYHIEATRNYQSCGSLQEGAYFRKDKHSDIVFLPQIEVDLKTSKDIKASNLYIHAYFYDATGQLVATVNEPSEALHLGSGPGDGTDYRYKIPKILPAGKKVKVYFALPAKDKLGQDWKAVVVLGGKKAAVAQVAPTGQESDFDYPEKDLVKQTALNPALEDVADDTIVPLIERVAITDNPYCPKFTLFLHLPHGVTKASDVKGVFAVCMLSDSVQGIRDQLNSIQPENDPHAAFAFAEAHQMAVLAWGGTGGGHTNLNYDQMDDEQRENSERFFGTLADAWEKTVLGMARDYGMPDHDFVLNGWSAAGEWACRLALEKPDRFLAVHIHVASKYQAPAPEGKKILWLLTSGELDPGANRALKFFADTRQMQYPVVFKSFIGLGHGGSPKVDALEARFFEYALALKSGRPAPDPMMPAAPFVADYSSFNTAPFYGDAVNQEMYPANQKNMIPPGFLVPLPNKDIADAWIK